MEVRKDFLSWLLALQANENCVEIRALLLPSHITLVVLQPHSAETTRNPVCNCASKTRQVSSLEWQRKSKIPHVPIGQAGFCLG